MPLIQPPEQTYSIETDRENISGFRFTDNSNYWESPPLMSDVVSESSCYVLVDKILMEPGEDYVVRENADGTNRIRITKKDYNIFIPGTDADDSSVVTILYRTEKAYELIPSDFIKQFSNVETNDVISKYLVYDENDKKIKLGKFTGDADPGQSIQTFTGSLNNLLSPGFYSNDNSVILVMTTSANILMQVRWSNTGVQEIRVRNSNNVWGDWNKSITEADGITKGAPTVPEGVNKPGVFYFNTGTISAVPNMPIIKNADDSIINFFQDNIPVKGLLEIIEGDDGYYVERIFMTFTLNSTLYAKVFYRIVENINEPNIPWYEVKTEEFAASSG